MNVYENGYIEFVGSVARDLAFPKKTALQRFMQEWEVFESEMSAVNYDLFCDKFNDRSRMRLSVMIILLYDVPGTGASPALDEAQILAKNADYGGSWCRRGGTGAFHMIARKYDRIDQQLKHHGGEEKAFAAVNTEQLTDTIGDLRRYMILVEAWWRAQEHIRQSVPSIQEF